MDRNTTSADLLHLLDGDAISDEQRAAILTRLIDLELAKPQDEADLRLINECFAYLAELSGDEPKSEEELQAGLLRISFRAPMPDSMRRSRRIHPAAVLAAALLTVAIFVGGALSLSSAARTSRERETWERWNDRQQELRLLYALQGTASLSGNGSLPPAFADGERVEVYTDVVTWLSTENLPVGLLYLESLPDGSAPDSILHTVSEDGGFCAVLSFDEADVRFLVTDTDTSQYALADGAKRVAVGKCVFGVTVGSDGVYRADCLYGSLGCRLTAPNEQTLLLALYSIRGVGGSA